jgi:AsmA family protein
MSQRQWKWAVALSLFTGLIVLAVVLFDWNWFKPIVEARASAALGRPVQIANLNARSLVPRLSFSIGLW